MMEFGGILNEGEILGLKRFTIFDSTKVMISTTKNTEIN